VRMTHWIHCNVCASLPSKSPDVVFFISSCGHLICARCLLRDGIGAKSPRAGVNGPCRVCNKHVSYKAINGDLPRDIQIFFQNPYALMERQGKQLRAVMKFQMEHQMRFYKLVQMKQQKLVDRAKEIEGRLSKSAEKERHLKADNDKLRHELSASMNRGECLEQELDSTRKELQEARQMVKSMTQSGGSTGPRNCPDLNGPTPMSTLSFANVVASTPLQNDTNLFTPEETRPRRMQMGGGGADSFHIDFGPFESPLAGAPDFLFKTPSSSTVKTSMSKKFRSAPLTFGSGFLR